MVVSEGIRREIKKRADLYEAAKEKIKVRIEDSINIAIEKLKAVQSDLFDEVEREFGRNPFAKFLSNEDTYTDADAKRLLAEQKIPVNFGPNEKSLSRLLKDIDSFRAWRNKLNPLDFVPKELKVNDVTCDSIALSWAAVNSDCVYEIELRSSTSLKSIHYSDKPEHTFYNLEPRTKHHIRVRAVFLYKDMKCMWSDPITAKTKSLYVKNVAVKTVSWGEIEVSWAVCGEEEKSDDEINYTVEMRKEGEGDWKEVKGLTIKKCRVGGLEADSVYEARVRCAAKGGAPVSEWSSIAKGKTLKWGCAWKECPDYVDSERKYIVDWMNPRIATKINDRLCTIIGNMYIPLNAVTSWNIKILKSKNNDGNAIYIGIAPNDINQNNGNNYYHKYGWYFDCYRSVLCSGPPHNYSCNGKEYGPRKREGQYVHTGDSVGVLMDTVKGKLSFVLKGKNRGIAYEGIPLDKPLVPCVILKYQRDSVEIVT